MKLEIAKLIEQAASDMCLDVGLREGYSGRGMYGEETAALVGSRQDIIAAIASAAVDIGGTQTCHLVPVDGVDFVAGIQQLKWDSMGKTDVVAY